MPRMRWIKPRLVAQIRFLEWMAEGRLRRAVFGGFREDKRARDVHRESVQCAELVRPDLWRGVNKSERDIIVFKPELTFVSIDLL